MFFLSVFLSLFLQLAFCIPSPGELKVPRVYNTVITSGENLTPSRAIPVFQPIFHETAYGYPLQQTLIYHDNYKNPSKIPGDVTSFASESKTAENLEFTNENPIGEDTTKLSEDKPNSGSAKKPQPKLASNNVSPETPLKLNDFGLPPSLIPIQQYPQRNPFPYESYNPYNPYYPSVYNHVPYPYNPYLIQNPYYNTPLLQPRPSFLPHPDDPFSGRPPFPSGPPPVPTGPPIPTFSTGPTAPLLPPSSPLPFGPSVPPFFTSPPQPQQKPTNETPTVPDSPPDLNIKNNSNKNPEIPDVPPPPLPKGGLKSDKEKVEPN